MIENYFKHHLELFSNLSHMFYKPWAYLAFLLLQVSLGTLRKKESSPLGVMSILTTKKK